MGEMVGRAFATAMAGRQGPVVLSLPHDVLPPGLVISRCALCRSAGNRPGDAQMAELEELLARSERPC